MIRITGGRFKGRSIKTPKGKKVRPTRSMIREAIFNMIGPRIVEATVLDLFSGSGLLGIEAKSRGAAKVFFVEQSRNVCKILRENIASLMEAPEDPVLCLPALKAIKLLHRTGVRFDLVLMDPPYALETGPILNALSATGMLKLEGWIVMERGKLSANAKLPSGLVEIKRKIYGTTTIYVLEARIH